MRKTVKHSVYTLEEKNKIVEEYLRNGHPKELVRRYDICDTSTLYKWKKQYLKHGTTIDNRGKSSKKGISRRPKKLVPEEMSREDLIEYVNATEDIKKLMVFLNKQKKNIK